MPLVVLTGIAAVGLFPYAWDQAGLQRVDHTSAHAAFYHWVEMAFHAAAIPFIGALAAYRPRACRMGGDSAGVALIILGAASLLFPQHASALQQPFAWAALIGGVAFIGLIELRRRRFESAGV